ncbi:unnamed protein product, partial [Mesorhabditis belari]|uniref:Serine/threonine-protein kinase PLK n=1 Tax=Mesorhabditis belari TaxID=2138241 RepID=A0AAF3F221_9BILA
MATKKPLAKEIPDVVYDDKGKPYKKGRFLGKGGFARCYELYDRQRNITFAGKIISKHLLKGSNQKEKVTQEVTIHRDLCHPHVVRFDGYFEDPENIYILLELCPRRSLVELHKRRGALTPPEVRYMTLQIAEGIEYLHARAIIHRDLKLANVFLNDRMIAKIGDFGLATMMEKGNERKKTLCGTPNYIAPEVLEKAGHAFEVDVWALGCILYTLLVGTPPFETKSLQETYRRIKSNQYRIPSTIGNTAAKVIRELLAANPASRPKIGDVRKYAYFTEYTPTHLPTSCLTLPPKFSKDLFNKLRATLLKGGTRNIAPVEDLAEAPECMPVFWVSKWVDYSAGEKFAPKEGDELARLPFLRSWFRTDSAIVLHLTNGTLQINFFADHTKLILCPHLGAVTFIDREKELRTFKLELLETHGFDAELRSRLKYAGGLIERLISKAGGIVKPEVSSASGQSARSCGVSSQSKGLTIAKLN